MYCSSSLLMHLLRGVGAIVLVIIAFFIVPVYPISIVPVLIGVMLLLRGCPMCWLVGLIEKVKGKRHKIPSTENK